MLSPKDQIKERLSIVDVISWYMKLQKAGKNYKGLSPFSNEKTPSFFVSPERDMYYCFSTSQGGDIFTFVGKMEGVDFLGALRILADRAGVELSHENKEKRDKRARLYNALEKATAFYERLLHVNKEAIEYLKGRGLKEKTIQDFHIGFAEDTWRLLYEHLKEKGFSDSELLEAGLIKKTEKKVERGEEVTQAYYDTFRGRIMFPIKDSAGRVVAFSGRILPSLENEKVGKYINSPETILYNKSGILYGYDRAKGSIKKVNFSVLVEGQMDVVMSHQAGYPNTVGVSGTAFTETQLTLLKRLSKNIVMAFDADSAGMASVGKSAELALSMGLDVKVARLSSGIDPAALIQKNSVEWKGAIRDSLHIVEFYLEYLRDAGYDSRKFKLQVKEVVLPFIARIKSPIDQAHFITLVSRKLGVSDEVVQEEIKKGELQEYAYPKNVVSREEILENKEQDSVEKKLASIIFLQEALKKSKKKKKLSVEPEDVIKQLKAVIGKEKTTELLNISKDRRNAEIFKAELLYESEKDMQDDIEDMLRTLEHRLVKKELEYVTECLRAAETKGDNKESSKLLKESKNIMERLSMIIGKV